MTQRSFSDENRYSRLRFKEIGAEAYRTALRSIAAEFPETLERLRSLTRDEVAAVASPWDDVMEVLDAVGVVKPAPQRHRNIDGSVKLLVTGCPLQDMPLSPFEVLQVLSNGGIVLSSDKAAAWMPVVAEILRTGKPRGPSRGRVVFEDTRPDLERNGALLPAVWLDHGHIPLAEPDRGRSDVQVIARNALNGEPLAIVVGFGGGYLIHAVPHWWQLSLGQAETALEARPVAAVPGLASQVPEGSGLTIGEFSAAQAMLTVMLAGLEYAFSRLDVGSQTAEASQALQLGED